ncbi:MAG: terminase small subunit [Rhodospirillales bacterium]
MSRSSGVREMGEKAEGKGQRKSGLTAKQAKFVEEYCIDQNGTQAALRAGYSEKTAYSIASENLRKPEISAVILERMAEHRARCESSIDGLTRKLWDICTAAMHRNQNSAAVQAVMAIARLHGFLNKDANNGELGFDLAAAILEGHKRVRELREPDEQHRLSSAI